MIFIAGTGRCGTTLLARMLNEDPAISAFIEPRFLIDHGGAVDYVDNTVTRSDFVENTAYSFNRKLTGNLKRFGVLPQAPLLYKPNLIMEIGRNVSAITPSGERNLFVQRFTCALFGLTHAINGTTQTVHKTPHTMCFASWLEQVFPGSLFVHIIRDPVDVCTSVIARNWGPRDPEMFVEWYNFLMEQAWVEFSKLDANRWLVVELEDLVDDPGRVLGFLFHWIGQWSQPHFQIDPQTAGKASALVDPGRKYPEPMADSDGLYVREGCADAYALWKSVSL